jgi:iron complex transport system substrate-binding protein
VKGNGITMAPSRNRPRPSLLLPSLLLPLLALALLLAACGETRSTTLSSIGESIGSPGPSTGASHPATPSYPLTLVDDAGASVTIAAAPRRIVSLAPSNTEIACALGACDELTGVTDFDNYPASVKDVARVVVQAKVDAEKVVAARPDLVLAAGNGQTPAASIRQLEDLGLTVLTLYPANLDGVYADIGLVGRALGRDPEAARLVASMKARVEAVVTAVAGAGRPRVFYEVSVFEGTIYTAGRDSFLASLIELAGGSPVAGDPHSTAIPLEDLVAADPEIILLGDASYDPNLADPAGALAAVRARPGWSATTAAREGRVVPFTSDIVTTRPGPRIVDGLEALARAIHPERFGR